MKLVKIVLVALVLVLNLVVVQPSWADRKFTQNPEYIEVTQALETALQEQQTQGITPENVQNIANLQFQKYIMETGKNYGQCRNETGKTLVIYGKKPKKSPSTYDNALYFLPDGETTDDGWDCDGIYLPSDAKVAGLTTPEGGSSSALAYKIVNGTRLIAKANPETSELQFNVPPAKLFKSGEANWLIPDSVQSLVDTGIAQAPIDD